MLVLIFIIGCEKKGTVEIITDKSGLMVYKNNKKSVNNNVEYSFKKINSIPFDNNIDSLASFRSPNWIVVDQNENIYISDKKDVKIKKFDKNGVFLKQFVNRGSGPGECNQINTFEYLDNKILISDANMRKVLIFNTEGDFMCDKKLQTMAPFIFKSYNKKLIGLSIEFRPKQNRTIDLSSKLNIYNNDFKYVKSVAKTTKNASMGNINQYDFAKFFCSNSHNFFASSTSEDIFEISSFDKEFNKKYKISLNYNKIKLSDDQVRQLSGFVNNPDEKEKSKSKEKYHKSIYGIWSDKYDRIWALSPKPLSSSDFVFYIFQDGKYIGSQDLDFLNCEKDFGLFNRIFFEKNHLYVIDENNEEISIYNYDEGK